MFLDLIERDREEALRCSSRTLQFPDGITREIKTYRLIWRWFDHLIAYEYCSGEQEILTSTLWSMKHNKVPIEEALGHVVEHIVTKTERLGGDITDDDVEALIAKKAASIKSRLAAKE